MSMKVVRPLRYASESFSRATTAWYYNEDGDLTGALVDELRLGYDPETLTYLGPIIENEATNRCIKNTDLTHAAWELVGFPLPTLETESIAAPDPGQLATKFEGGTAATSIRQSISPASGTQPMAWAVYLKPVGSVTVVRLSIGAVWATFSLNSDGTVNFTDGTNPYVKPLQDGWFRCELWTSISGAQLFSIGKATSGSGDFYIYQPQAEQVGASTGYRATSVIPNSTTSPATRAADIQTAPPALVSSNVLENDYDEYNPATAYSIGDRVIDSDLHRAYESVIPGAESNTGNEPSTSPNAWVDIGPTNRWRMFTMTIGADIQTTRDAGIDVTLSFPTGVTDVVLFNVAGLSARVRVFVGEQVIYDVTKQLLAPLDESSWWLWFFGERARTVDVLFDDIPPHAPGSIRIEIEGPGAACGKVAVGKAKVLGFSEFGSTSIGIRDYSVKDTDAFGNTTVTERRYKDKSNTRVVVDPGAEIPIKRYLADLRATPCAYIIETRFDPVLLLGRYEDFEVMYSTAASSYCTLQLEGL